MITPHHQWQCWPNWWCQCNQQWWCWWQYWHTGSPAPANYHPTQSTTCKHNNLRPYPVITAPIANPILQQKTPHTTPHHPATNHSSKTTLCHLWLLPQACQSSWWTCYPTWQLTGSMRHVHPCIAPWTTSSMPSANARTTIFHGYNPHPEHISPAPEPNAPPPGPNHPTLQPDLFLSPCCTSPL